MYFISNTIGYNFDDTIPDFLLFNEARLHSFLCVSITLSKFLEILSCFLCLVLACSSSALLFLSVLTRAWSWKMNCKILQDEMRRLIQIHHELAAFFFKYRYVSENGFLNARNFLNKFFPPTDSIFSICKWLKLLSRCFLKVVVWVLGHSSSSKRQQAIEAVQESSHFLFYFSPCYYYYWSFFYNSFFSSPFLSFSAAPRW